jgi:hypothetical protein
MSSMKGITGSPSVEALDEHDLPTVCQCLYVGRGHIQTRFPGEFQAGTLHGGHVEAVLRGRELRQVLLAVMDHQCLGSRTTHGPRKKDLLQLCRNGRAGLDAVRRLQQVFQFREWRQQTGGLGACQVGPEIQGAEAMRPGLEQIDRFRHGVRRHL